MSRVNADSPLELTLVAPFQDTVEDKGVTTTKPLLIMPCRGATKPTYPGDGDAFLVFRNVSRGPIQLSLRNPVPVSLTFFTPSGTVLANKWLPMKYIVSWTIPACHGQYIYTLKPGEIRVCPINLFQIARLADDPLDWMAVYSTSRVSIKCTLHLYDDERALNVNSGWLPIAVHEPDTDDLGTVPKGSSVEAVPSSNAGYPPNFVAHPPGR
jgi:hypothetical protein